MRHSASMSQETVVPQVMIKTDANKGSIEHCSINIMSNVCHLNKNAGYVIVNRLDDATIEHETSQFKTPQWKQHAGPVVTRSDIAPSKCKAP